MRKSGDGHLRARTARGPVFPEWTRAWAGDSLVMVAGQFLAMLATSAVAILAARELSRNDWAVFSAFLGLALGFAIVVDFGLTTWLLRELSRLAAERSRPGGADAAGRILAAALAFNGGAALVFLAGTVSVALALGTPDSEVFALGLFIVYIGLLAMAGAWESRLRALRRISWVAGATVIEKVVLLALVLAAIGFTEVGLLAIAASYPLAGATRLAIVGAAGLPGIRLQKPRGTDVRRVLRSSMPFAIAAGALNLIPRLDTIAVLGFSTTTAAYLALADRILGPALVVPVVLSLTLYPFIASRTRPRDGWKLAVSLGAIGAVIAATGIAVSPSVVPLVFGDKYRAAVLTVQVFMVCLPFIYASNVLLAFLYSAGRERLVLLATLAVSVVGTAAIILGQSLGGSELAAAGAVLRQVLFSAVLVAIGRRAPRAPGRDAEIPPIVSGHPTETGY